MVSRWEKEQSLIVEGLSLAAFGKEKSKKYGK